jgi:hypothetical protein
MEPATDEKLTKSDHAPEGGNACKCGCVPNMMSLFQMAELRAKYREQKRLAEEAEKKKMETAEQSVKPT